MNRLIGAMDLPFVWQVWDDKMFQRHIDLLAAAGINTFLTESDQDVYNHSQIEIVHRAGLRYFGGLNCFFSPDAVANLPELLPVDQTGSRYPERDWYTAGIVPTHDDFNAHLVEFAARLVKTYDMDGLLLNFIRWPLYWEYELRPDTPAPTNNSFDQHTFQRFQTQTGISLPTLPTAGDRAAWILEHHRQAWTDFKCDVITGVVQQLVEAVRAERGDQFPIGLALVPAPPDILEPVLGQRIPDLAPLVDFFMPMAYHSIVHQPQSWVTQILDTIGHEKLIPLILADSAQEINWAPLPEAEWCALVEVTLAHPHTQGVALFMGTYLLESGRDKLLRKIIEK